MNKNFQLSSLILQFRGAFTLLEMLVVIGIISIMLGVASVSYSTAQKKARDAKRKTDLHAMQNALEQCYAVNSSSYPIITGGGSTSIAEDCPVAGGPDLTITDPTAKTYTVSTSLTAYDISVVLEDGTTFRIVSQQ